MKTRHLSDCLVCIPFFTETADSCSDEQNLGITKLYNKSLSFLKGDEQAEEKTVKKTTTKAKKKTEKKAKASIFDDDVPSIFDDPLNATSK